MGGESASQQQQQLPQLNTKFVSHGSIQTGQQQQDIVLSSSSSSSGSGYSSPNFNNLPQFSVRGGNGQVSSNFNKSQAHLNSAFGLNQLS